MSEQVVIRKSDRAIFEPSHPDDYDDGQCYADFLMGRTDWYFRRLVPVKRSWWFGFKLVRDGSVWEPEDESLFDVQEKKDVLMDLRRNPPPHGYGATSAL